MALSKLRQVLMAFEKTNGSLSMAQLAQDLDVSPEQLNGMIQHWVRKGKIREVQELSECGNCGSGDDEASCAFVMEMPRSYELASEDTIPLRVFGGSCLHKTER
ncbi:MAG: hypothetical protein CSA11_11490 [Chloroflexi bacterium]|nr:MAG: hypothetical protein CSB13_04985 [Chloroflexota bacterium]PIE79608.1 MAG: hypothetical protein CSA11_11490 [Chloroflexota bacterium]